MSDPSESGAKKRLDKIYQTIRTRICLLKYKPNQRLSEETLAKEFNVSRTPVRSVLNRLESEGLVQSRHGAGTFVTDVNFEELVHVYRLRAELAGVIGKLDPVKPTQKQVQQLRDIAAKCASVPRARNPKQAFAQVNIDFFKIFVSMIANIPLRQTIERLFYQSQRIWLTVMPDDDVIKETRLFHTEILDTAAAAETGRMKNVGKLNQKHILHSLARLRRYAEQSNNIEN